MQKLVCKRDGPLSCFRLGSASNDAEESNGAAAIIIAVLAAINYPANIL
jgi:hypothetical protein